MAAYCFFDILQVHNEEALETYREQVLDTVNCHRGRYIVIGGPFERKEGAWEPVFPVMIEFPTMDSALNWYHSEEYASLKNLRLAAVTSNAVFLQGI